jgi:hypothetical protein
LISEAVFQNAGAIAKTITPIFWLTDAAPEFIIQRQGQNRL